MLQSFYLGQTLYQNLFYWIKHQLLQIIGHLDRVVHGLTAEEILNNCDENAVPVFDQLTNPNLTLAQAFKRRNLATFKNLAQQKLQALSQNQQTSGAKLDLSQPQDFPMYIEGIRTNTLDPEGHVIFFDTEALIGIVFTANIHKFISQLFDAVKSH